MSEGPEILSERKPLELVSRPPGPVSAPLGRLLLAYVLLLAIPSLLHTLETGAGPFGNRVGWIGSIAALVALAGGVALFWVRLRPLQLPPVRLEVDRLELPLSEASGRVARVRVADIDWLERRGSGDAERIRMGVRRGPLVTLHARALEQPGELDSVWTRLRARVSALCGNARLRDLDARAEQASTREARFPFVTLGLCAAIVVGYGLQLLGDAVDDPLSVVHYGGNAPALVASGEWFRLVTANFLHGGAVHCYWNLVTLGVIGWRLERLLGSGPFASVVGLGALGGTVVSAFVAAGVVSAGASTLVFAMLGSITYLNGVHPDGMSPGLRMPFAVVTILLLTIVLSTLLVANVDHGGHAGGFVVGAAVTAALTLRAPWPGLFRTRTTVASGIALGLAATFALSAVAGVRNALLSPEEKIIRWAESPAIDADVRPSLLNDLAWVIATTPGLPVEKLDLALTAAERAHALDPNSVEIQDTLATALYRTGNLERAIALERDIAEREGLPFYWSQLTRFERGYSESSGPLRLGPRDGELPRVEGDTLVHTGSGPFEAHLVVSAGGELLGLSRVTASRDAPTRITLALPDRLPADARIELALYDTGASADGTTRSIWDAFDPQVGMLPGNSPLPDDG